MQKMHKRFERYALFSEVAKQLSFSKAAENLGISRSYLSSQINQLEQELDTSLLIRSTRNVRLTAAGEKILAKMQFINTSIVELEKELDHTKSDVSGLLRITAPTIFSHRFLIDICHQFQQQYPEIEFDLDVGYNREDLTKSHFDLAIRATNNPPDNMVAKKLIPYQHICCASPEYLEKHGVPSHPDELVHHNCLSDPNLRRWQFIDNTKSIEVETNGDMLINDNLLLLTAAQQGKGIIKMPSYLVQPSLDSGQLVQLLPNYFIARSNIYLIYPPQLRSSNKLAAFIEFTQKWFEGK
ncbi:LysR family transcriptional regulator [Vibrio europaeus]|uniref:LysR family transcriptional regulator n=1 Tax=Vibrio europaeus TaxID=300876 RepID=A0A178JDC4_9VIBR|nr:LysR family transcriptional regulator [Vibrio europaeus]MDC5703343.1 LysR family transcriptional regulator [Vibrio europaeus]MDC5711502.1 LysR family transcriptional regulator [Vibrio europaeus]MDC5714995.1 LysR family transcriptional regulator [Vibrio europaeus]MDC5722067.1 LysR family transcriptional regulator [Vibrio europaeus]MDC5727613.1 LysR family transcriptional regulator [Vibrio europaeus]